MKGENLDLFGQAPPGAPAPGVDRRQSVPDVEDSSTEPDEALGSASDADPGADADSEPGPTVWTVSQVNRAVRLQLEQRLPQLWVTGEVANFSQQRSGHCYFTLKDETAQIRCVMFRREAERLPALPEEGSSVTVFGGLTLYEARGSYQLLVNRLQLSDVEGLWKLAFERTRKKLDQEGLLDPARKRPLPRFPRRIGVVTSPTGAALRDIISVTRRRAPWLRLVIRGTRVQGEGAGLEIADALRVMGERGGVEMIILARGGGSIEDLWGFNEEAVARAIASCPVPVVSGVGHEVDVTIADLVADVRAATPSAAAEAAAPDREAVLHLFRNTRRRLARGLSDQVARRRWRLERAGDTLVRSGRNLAEGRRRRVAQMEDRMAAMTRQRTRDARARLARLTEGLEARSPLSTLARGYAVPLDGTRVLRNRGAFAPGQPFRLRVVDGSVPCLVDVEHQP
ncbi:MAG: exodeoxyribonuclease VII large subunit [Gemmatimonadota bacterium]|nr:exodeoxyribonuclease VII large subunit [Gemmatimonadota bacterium]